MVAVAPGLAPDTTNPVLPMPLRVLLLLLMTVAVLLALPLLLPFVLEAVGKKSGCVACVGVGAGRNPEDVVVEVLLDSVPGVAANDAREDAALPAAAAAARFMLL